MSKKSIEAMENIRPTDKVKIANLLINGSCTLHEISNKLNLLMSTTSARVSELCDLGAIYETPDGYFHPSTSEGMALRLRQERDMKRYKKWVKLGEKNGFFDTYKDVEAYMDTITRAQYGE